MSPEEANAAGLAALKRDFINKEIQANNEKTSEMYMGVVTDIELDAGFLPIVHVKGNFIKLTFFRYHKMLFAFVWEIPNSEEGVGVVAESILVGRNIPFNDFLTTSLDTVFKET
jgi:hypothetical protein